MFGLRCVYSVSSYVRGYVGLQVPKSKDPPIKLSKLARQSKKSLSWHFSHVMEIKLKDCIVIQQLQISNNVAGSVRQVNLEGCYPVSTDLHNAVDVYGVPTLFM